MTSIHTYYDDLSEGRTFAPHHFTVTEADMAGLASCISVAPLRSEGGEPVPQVAPEGQPAVSPFLLNTFRVMREAISMPDGLLHARETIRLFEPVRPGDALTLTLRVQSKYIKNDKKFVLLRHDVTRDGVSVMSFDRLIVWVK